MKERFVESSFWILLKKDLFLQKHKYYNDFESSPISTKKTLKQYVNLLCWSRSQKDETPQQEMLMDPVSMTNRQTIVWFTTTAYAYS